MISHREVIAVVQLRMDIEASILGSDIVKIRGLLARAMAGNDVPDELIHRTNQRRLGLEIIKKAEEALAAEVQIFYMVSKIGNF